MPAGSVQRSLLSSRLVLNVLIVLATFGRDAVATSRTAAALDYNGIATRQADAVSSGASIRSTDSEGLGVDDADVALEKVENLADKVAEMTDELKSMARLRRELLRQEPGAKIPLRAHQKPDAADSVSNWHGPSTPVVKTQRAAQAVVHTVHASQLPQPPPPQTHRSPEHQAPPARLTPEGAAAPAARASDVPVASADNVPIASADNVPIAIINEQGPLRSLEERFQKPKETSLQEQPEMRVAPEEQSHLTPEDLPPQAPMTAAAVPAAPQAATGAQAPMAAAAVPAATEAATRVQAPTAAAAVPAAPQAATGVQAPMAAAAVPAAPQAAKAVGAEAATKAAALKTVVSGMPQEPPPWPPLPLETQKALADAAGQKMQHVAASSELAPEGSQQAPAMESPTHAAGQKMQQVAASSEPAPEGSQQAPAMESPTQAEAVPGGMHGHFYGHSHQDRLQQPQRASPVEAKADDKTLTVKKKEDDQAAPTVSADMPKVVQKLPDMAKQEPPKEQKQEHETTKTEDEVLGSEDARKKPSEDTLETANTDASKEPAVTEKKAASPSPRPDDKSKKQAKDSKTTSQPVSKEQAKKQLDDKVKKDQAKKQLDAKSQKDLAKKQVDAKSQKESAKKLLDAKSHDLLKQAEQKKTQKHDAQKKPQGKDDKTHNEAKPSSHLELASSSSEQDVDFIEPLPEKVRQHAQRVTQREQREHSGHPTIELPPMPHARHRSGHFDADWQSAPEHMSANSHARQQWEHTQEHNREMRGSSGTFQKAVLDSVEAFARTASDYYSEARSGSKRIVPKSFPSSAAGNPADVVAASRVEEVAVMEPVTPLAVVFEASDQAKPCVSPVWAAGDPVCANARKVTGKVMDNDTEITYYLVPANEKCQIRCSKENWYMTPSQGELQCDDLLFKDVPAELECTCCQNWIMGMFLMAPICVITFIMLCSVCRSGGAKQPAQAAPGETQAQPAVATETAAELSAGAPQEPAAAAEPVATPF